MSETKEFSIYSLMARDDVRKRFDDILNKNAPAFISSVITLVATSALAECEPKSILSAAIAAASLNLQVNPSLGQACILPYKDKTGIVKAQFQIMKKGFIQLSLRSGQFNLLNETPVYSGELKTINRLTGELDLSGQKTDNKIIGNVAYFKLLNGFEKSLYMSIEQILAHGKKYSKSFDKPFGLWKMDFDTMASKTVLKLLLSRYAPLSVEMQTALMQDQSEIKINDNLEITDLTYPDQTDAKNGKDDPDDPAINSEIKLPAKRRTQQTPLFPENGSAQS
jgi:recombination protein RecT